MPGIWNINNGYNTNSKKVSSKLTFEVGEKFTGRLVSKGEGKDVTIKLSDGWQFIAEVDGEVNLEELKLVKFQVEGSENGKLKLKLVNDDSKNNTEVDENFQEIIEKEGLSKEDISILKKMITYNIPLTRKNINDIKSLLQFNQKININKDEVDSFIEKYIVSKNIDLDSDQAKAIKDTLSKFFLEFENMNEDDIMLFVENNIEFNEENIESYNKLFKGDSSIEKVLDNIKDKLKDMDFEKILKENSNVELPKIKTSSEETLSKREVQGSAIASKLYAENDPSNNKIDVLDILKTLASTNEESIENNNSEKKQVNMSDKTVIDKEITDKTITSLLKKDDVLEMVKKTITNSTSINQESDNQAFKLIETRDKNNLENLFSKIEGKNVTISEEDFKKIVEYVKEKNVAEQLPSKEIEFAEKSTSSFKELESNFTFSENIKDLSRAPLKAQIKYQMDKASNVVKGLLNQTELNDNFKDKIMSVVKENMNDFKVFNSVSNEYYYMNFNVTAQNLEYPCKMIIKDNRKDGKKIDTTNVKMVVSVKTLHLGEIDSYLTLRDNRIDVNLRCNNDYEMILKKHRNELVDGLQTLGLLVNVTVSSKDQEVNIANCRNFFNDVTISAIDTRV